MSNQGTDLKSRSAFNLWLFGLLFSIFFTTLVWLLGPNLGHFVDTFLVDKGASWYYWQLPSRDSLGMVIVWALYLAHQFSIWAAIYFAYKNLHGFREVSWWGLPKYSFVALAINTVFVFLHLLQTQFWFDGLAQDVPIFTSQYSVIIVLAVVLILENPRRGFFLGWKARKPFTAQVTAFFRRIHMYVFAWALVYTFWFHPMAVDPQLISGFLYMFLLFTQMTVAWTPVHLKRNWIVLLESYVAIHAAIVAVFNTSFFNSPVMWPMFLSGFTFMFIFTYIYAFRVSRKIYWLTTAVYVLFLIWLYLPEPLGYGRSLAYLMRLEFLWIPIILHALAWLFAGLTYVKLRK
ncbi:hypothetical protein ACFLVM_02085 [Chloroflexota bacterium]